MTVATEVAQVLAFLLCVAFPAQYAYRVRSWRSTAEGWYLMLSHVAFAAILALGVVSVFAGPAWMAWAGRPYVRLAVYVALCLVFVVPSVLLSLRVRGGRRKR